MSDIREWLEELGLGRYADAFEKNEIDVEALPHVTDDDLKEIGVGLGSRRKILAAISEPSVAAESKPKARLSTTLERRQLTVMFCDLVGSTALSEKLDPEDLREVMAAYQKTAGAVIERYEGHVAQYLGDGLMVYFGWPKAHEDDAERAVRAGLDIVEAVKQVEAPEELRVRVGISTGRVVVGETGAGDASVPKAAVGETPNLAARLQGLAGPDQIVIGPSTRRLVGDAFECEKLGSRTLKGIDEPVSAERVIGVADVEDRFEAARGAHLTPLVGRKEELALLMRRWQQARSGEGQVVLLTGEPGIGKSRITQVLRERVAGEPHIRLRYQCSPYHTNSALYPVITQIERAAGFVRGESMEARLDKLDTIIAQGADDVEKVAPLIAAILSLEIGNRYPPLAMSPQKQKDETLKALAAQVVHLAATQPVLMIFEDAHWIDPTTQEALDQIVPALAALRVLMVITYRPEYQPPWIGQSHVAPITLTRLGREDAATMVGKVTGTALPDEVLEQIVAKTDGVPLFVEELAKTVIESGVVDLTDAGQVPSGALPALAIPLTLQDSLLARLDRLSPTKEVAQIGACIGREFSHELLAAVSPLRDNDLAGALQELVNSELVFRRGNLSDATYTFKHALVQDAAYGSLLKSKRQQLHADIAKALEDQLPDIKNDNPELLAHHYTEARIGACAAEYWLRAGTRANERSALLEAVSHLEQGIKCASLILNEKDRKEANLRLRLALGPALMSVRGRSSIEVRRLYQEARVLAEEIGNPQNAFLATWGVWFTRLAAGDVSAANNLVEEMFDLAERQSDSSPLLEAHHSAWTTDFIMGAFGNAHEHCEHGRRLFDRKIHAAHKHQYGHHDPGACAAVVDALSLWCLGYTDQAVDQAEAAISAAEKCDHLPTLVHTIRLAALIPCFTGNHDMAQSLANKLALLTRDREMRPMLASARALNAWVMAVKGEMLEARDELRESLKGSLGLMKPWCLATLADCSHRLNERRDALIVIKEALEGSAAGMRWWDSELHRIQGILLLSEEHSSKAVVACETSLMNALDIAQGQKAKSLELRAATSLARVWVKQGKNHEAHDLLFPIYEWFTEGFDTADLKDAKALLDELN